MRHFRARTLWTLLFSLGPAALLAGCGGGGGGSNNNPGGGGGGQTYPGTITGKIVDTTGAPAPAAYIYLDDPNSQPQVQSFSQGGYRLDKVQPGFHIIYAKNSASTYTGSEQVGVPNQANNFISNVNIIVSPPAQQATAQGHVYDTNNKPLPGATVYFQSTLEASPSSQPGFASLIAITRPDGSYQITNLPTKDVNGGPRSYVVTASYPTGNASATYTNGTPLNETFTAGSSVMLPDFHLAASANSQNALVPTLNFVQAFTQPDIQPANTAHARPAVAVSGTNSVYEQIRRSLSPAYVQWSAHRRAAARIRHAASAAQPHASILYTIEMEMFFSLPGDSATTVSSQRSLVSGFGIDNNAAGSLVSYDFLQDPLANFYADPDVGATPVYFADHPYTFGVEATALDGATSLTPQNQISTQTVTPLEFIGLAHPADPNDTGAVETLPNAADSAGTIQWNAISGAASYTVYIYGTFPGVSTAPIYQSAALPATTTSAALPTGLKSGTEYWVVVAAASTANSAQSSAISVSQIVPFYVMSNT